MKKKSTAVSPAKLSQKHAAEIAAAQKKADDAKTAAKAAKAAYKEARKNFKEARKRAKAEKKAVKTLKADLAAAALHPAPSRKSAPKPRAVPELTVAPQAIEVEPAQ
jgi:hypothetical protein